jgi:Ca2+-binding RTX toxin-like protein
MSHREIEEIETEDDNTYETTHSEFENDYRSAVQTSSHDEDTAEFHSNNGVAGISELQAGVSASIHRDGTDGDDDILGDDGDDILIAGLGNDHLEGGDGNDTLFGDDGDDVLRAGFGKDILTGGAGFDDFTFYASGDFKVTDYNTSDDSLVFDSATTGLHDLNELLRVITNISDTTEGVVIEFGQVATITLVGLTIADFNAGMVHFS